MPLSMKERQRRYDLVRGIMAEKGLSAILAASSATSPGNVRYLSDYPPHSGYSYVLFPLNGDPTQFVRSKIQEQLARERWVQDARFVTNYPDAIAKRIKELGLESKRIGLAGVENIPFKTYEYLRKELPSADFLDVTKELFDLRMIKSEEEQQIARECGRITDRLFERIREVATPGITEYDIYAEMDYFLRKNRVEGAFNLIGSGLFPVAPSLVPSERVLREEDSILVELTPRFQGYHTQLTVVHPLREPNPRMRDLLQIAREAQKEGLKFLRPGNRVSDVANAMRKFIEAAGYSMPYRGGHSMGHEHTEPPAVVPDDHTMIQPGMTLVIHPCVMDTNGEGVFFGDSYLVTESGFEPLHMTFLRNNS